MAYSTFPWFFQRFTSADGSPLAGGSVEFLAAGSGARKDIYLDQSGNTASNPMPLDSTGFPEHDYFGGTGEYDIVVRDSVGALVRKILRISVVGGSSYVDDHKVAVDASDTNPGYLDQKLVSSADVVVVVSDGDSLSLVVSDALKYRVKASPVDTTPGFLSQKIESTDTVVLEVVGDKLRARFVGPNIIGVTEDDDDPAYLADKLEDSDTIEWHITGYPGGQHVRAKLKSTVLDDHKVIVSNTDTVPGVLDDKIRAGTGIVITHTTDEDGEHMHVSTTSAGTAGKVKVNTSDSTAGYLEQKVVAGAGIAVTNVDIGGGYREMRIAAQALGYQGQIKSYEQKVRATATAPIDVVSVTLTAGTWDVSGSTSAYVSPDGGDNIAGIAVNITSTPGASLGGAIPTDGHDVYAMLNDTSTSSTISGTVSTRRFVLTATTTIYLNAQCRFGLFAYADFWGNIEARQVA